MTAPEAGERIEHRFAAFQNALEIKFDAGLAQIDVQLAELRKALRWMILAQALTLTASCMILGFIVG